MFRDIFRLQAQDFALTAIPAAVKQDIYLLHEISPEFVRIRVSRIHEFVDAGQFYFVILFQLDIENGRACVITRHIGGVVERRRREVEFVCGSFCSVAGAVRMVAAGAVTWLVAATSAAGMIAFAISFKYSLTGGAKIILHPLPKRLQVVGFIPFDTTKI